MSHRLFPQTLTTPPPNTLLDHLNKASCDTHPDQPLNVLCYTDHSLMCFKCSLDHRGHRLNTFDSRNDAFELITQLAENIFCAKHEENVCLFYCHSEERVVCERCSIAGCKTHDVSEIDEIYRQCGEELDQVDSQINTLKKCGAIENMEKMAQEMVKLVENKRKEEILNVESQIDGFIEKLIHRKKEIIQKVDAKFDACLGEISQKISNFEQLASWNSFYDQIRTGNRHDLIKFCKQTDGVKVLSDEVSKIPASLTSEEIKTEFTSRLSKPITSLQLSEVNDAMRFNVCGIHLPLLSSRSVPLICYPDVNDQRNLIVLNPETEKTETVNGVLAGKGNQNWMVDEKTLMSYFYQGSKPVVEVYSLPNRKRKALYEDVPSSSIVFADQTRSTLYFLCQNEISVFDVKNGTRAGRIPLPEENEVQGTVFGSACCVMKMGDSDVVVYGHLARPDSAGGLFGGSSAEPRFSFFNLGEDYGLFKSRKWKTIRFPSFEGCTRGNTKIVPLTATQILLVCRDPSGGFGFGNSGPDYSAIIDIYEESTKTNVQEFEGENLNVEILEFGDFVDLGTHVTYATDKGRVIKVHKSTFKVEG